MERKRYVAALVALALTGMTQCGAIGGGAIGGGSATDGAIGGGAIGGLPSGAASIPNNIPDSDNLILHYAARLETGYSDEDSVTTVTDQGTQGNDLSSTGTGSEVLFQSPCLSGKLGEHPCFQFQGGKYLQGSNFTPLDGVTTIAMVRAPSNTSAGTRIAVDLGSTSDTAPWLTQAATLWAFYKGGQQPSNGTATTDKLDVLCMQVNDDSAAAFLWRENVKEDLNTVSITGSEQIQGITVGAQNGGSFDWFGYIAELMVWAPGSTVTCPQAEEYLTRIYGPMPNGESEDITDGSKDGCADSLANADLCPSVGICMIGIIADSTGDTPTDGSNWPTLLNGDLDGCFDVQNEAQSGSKVGGGCTDNWNNNLEGNGMDVVITACGLNDIRSDGADGTTTANTLHTNVHTGAFADTSGTLGTGATVLNLGSTPFKLGGLWTADKQSEMDEMIARFATLASGQGKMTHDSYYEYMEDLDGSDEFPDTTGGSAEYWSYDGLHPTASDSALYTGPGTTRMKDYVLQHFDGSTPP